MFKDKILRKFFKNKLLIRRSLITSSEEFINTNNSINRDSEEALRLVMVLIYPYFIINKTTKIDKKILIENIEIIAKKSSLLDLRFIDALNNLYESWPKYYFKEGYKIFLGYYSSALDKIIKSI